jgi:DNA-binding NarL/FixJ family response regulator
MHADDLNHFLKRHPRVPTALLADEISPATVASFLQAGLLGVVPRDLEARVIVQIFAIILLGSHYVPPKALNPDLPNMSPHFAKRTERFGKILKPRIGQPPVLSPRQHQIMQLVELGSTNKSIARALGISEGTVKIHLSSTFQALGVSNRAAAVAVYNSWHFKEPDVSRAPNAAPGSAPIASLQAYPYKTEKIETTRVAPQQADIAARWLLAAQPETPYRAILKRASKTATQIPDQQDKSGDGEPEAAYPDIDSE